MKLDRAAAERAMTALGERARSVADAGRARHLPRRHRGDGGGGARACHRPRRRLPRHAAVRIRRRRPGACLRGREPAAELVRDRAAAAERAVGVRHAGDVAAARSGAQRSRARRRARLGAGRPHARRARARSVGSAARGRLRARRASSSFSAPTCAISASRASSRSRSTPIRARIATPRRIARVFEEAYRKLYGVNPSHVPIELVTWRVTARGPVIPFNRATDACPTRPAAPRTSRPVHAWSDGAETPVYDRKSLAAGQTIAGPAIIEERETTTAIPPGWSATVDQIGCIIAKNDSKERLSHGRQSSSKSSGRNLIGIVSERAKALQRIAFSPVVREAGDLACALFDRRGRMVAQANTGTPGHINSLAIAGAHLVEPFRQPHRAGRRAHHQRSLAVGRALLRHHGADADLRRRQGHRLSSARPSTIPISAATASAPAPATCTRKACGFRRSSSTSAASRAKCCTR